MKATLVPELTAVQNGALPLLLERPDAIGIVPDLLVLRPGHGDDDLLGAARRLRRGRLVRFRASMLEKG